MDVQCIVNRNMKLSDQTGKMYLTTPLDREANSFFAQSIFAFSIGRRFKLSIVPFVSATK